MNVVAASRPRCLAVAAGLTAAGWGAAAVLVRSVATAAASTRTPDDALVHLCLAALVLATGWAWLQGMAGVADAWRGASTARGGVRRLALAACGVALVGSLVSPAAHASTDVPGPDLLTGLPMPERAVGPARAGQRTVVVERGDTLWSVAAVELGPRATDREISDGWQRVYRSNRAVIGSDPDRIFPGQHLRLPHLTKEQP
jgi:nucleoid-associated protein YgaU